MTVAEAIAVRSKEEAQCLRCLHYVCRMCTECNHGSNFEPVEPLINKINDRSLDNYR